MNNNYLHEFKREKLIQFCYICQDSWPINDTAVSKYEICTICGVTIHAGCRNFAKLCYPCDNTIIHQKLTSQYLHDINCSGRVVASLVHAYDLGISPGTQLYGIFKVSTCQEILKTHIATMGEHDCVWDTSHKSTFDPLGDTPPSPQPNNNFNNNNNLKEDNLINSIPNPENQSASLRHIYHPRNNNRVVFAPPLLHLEIWRSFLGVFDNKVASCDTSLLPLLLHPRCIVERWFGLRNIEGKKAGMILMKLAFYPDEELISTSISINAPIERPKVTLSLIDNEIDEDENNNNNNRIKRSHSNVIEVNPIPINIEEERNDSIKDDKIEETRENDVHSQNILENNSNQTAIEIIHVQPELLPPIINAENEKLSIEENIVDNQISNTISVALNVENHINNESSENHVNISTKVKDDKNIINKSDDNNDNNDGINSNTNNQKDSSNLERKDSITKEEQKIELNIESKLLNSNNTTEKWQEWWNTTSTQLTKNLKERSTRAYDAISSITSSASIRKRKRKDSTNEYGNQNSELNHNVLNSGIGILHVELISAYKSFAKDAAEGDHFAVINICTAGSLATTEPLVDTDQEVETQVIQSSSTPIFNVKYEFVVPHYRSAVKFTLVDAISEKKIGVASIHLYEIIQRDADKYQGKWESAEIEKITMKDISGKNNIGYFTAKVRFQEDNQALFISSDPRKAPGGPPEAMSLDRVRVHVRRFGNFIEVIKVLFGRYRRLMDWENPVFTFVIFVLFVYFTLYLDAEYALCAPLFLLVGLMTESWFYRQFGYFKKKWVATEDDSLNYPYRPVSYLRLAVAGFRNFGSKGIPKNPPSFVRITLLPEGENNNTSSNIPIQEYHIATFSTIGDGNGVRIREKVNLNRNQQNSNGGGLSQFISALNITKSDSTIKDALLQNVSDPWIRTPINNSTNSNSFQLRQNSSEQYSVDQIVDVSYLYPILQKICENDNEQISNDDDKNNNNNNNNSNNNNSNNNNSNSNNNNTKQKSKKKKLNFVPWSKSSAVIKFTFYGDNPLGSFLDNAWGSVQIPIRELVDKKGSEENDEHTGVQSEVRLWKDIIWTSAYVQRLRSMETNDEYVENIGDLDNPYHAIFAPRDIPDMKQISTSSAEVLLRLQLDVRQSSQNDPHPNEVEVSRVVQSLVIPKNEKSETTISAIWNARDHIKYVQNILAGVINNLESFKNIFNWTVPSKTFPIYALLVITWIATILIPGRYLILLVGLSEFFFIFFPQPEELPLSIKVQNLLKSLPNDDDLFEIYREEREINGAVFEERRRERLKQVKLRLVLDCLWDGAVNIKETPNTGSATVWVPAFLVVQGHRLVWWATEDDVHEGNAPVGEIILQGHAGTTHASPVDIREMGNDHRLVVVFGRDSIGGQIKKTILCKDADSCTALKSVVNIILYGEDITS